MSSTTTILSAISETINKMQGEIKRYKESEEHNDKLMKKELAINAELRKELLSYQIYSGLHYEYRFTIPGNMRQTLKIMHKEQEILVSDTYQILIGKMRIQFRFPTLLQKEELQIYVDGKIVTPVQFGYKIVKKSITKYRIELITRRMVGLIKLNVAGKEIIPITERTRIDDTSYVTKLYFKSDVDLKKEDVQILERGIDVVEYSKLGEGPEIGAAWELSMIKK